MTRVVLERERRCLALAVRCPKEALLGLLVGLIGRFKIDPIKHIDILFDFGLFLPLVHGLYPPRTFSSRISIITRQEMKGRK